MLLQVDSAFKGKSIRGENMQLQQELRALWTQNINLQKEVARLELIVYGNFPKQKAAINALEEMENPYTEEIINETPREFHIKTSPSPKVSMGQEGKKSALIESFKDFPARFNKIKDENVQKLEAKIADLEELLFRKHAQMLDYDREVR